ncbi:hypothetical protein GGI43DRAFT_243862 [Trichoderma evansii]
MLLQGRNNEMISSEQPLIPTVCCLGALTLSAPFLVPARPRVSMNMEIRISTPTIKIDCAPYLFGGLWSHFLFERLARHGAAATCYWVAHPSMQLLHTRTGEARGWLEAIGRCNQNTSLRIGPTSAQRKTKTAICYHVLPEACTEHYLYI